MKIFADLHLHSHYSRATSKLMNVLDISKYAKYKGLNLLGTGDFTHPKWISELKDRLKPNGSGLYEYEGMLYVLQAEISNIYTHLGRVRKIHHVLLAPDFKTVDKINEALLKWGRLDYDGRPIFGKSSMELVELVMNINPDCEVIPAHAWTPWFGLFGSMSGYDDIKDCYGEQLRHIHAIETGLSSDPAMNWRCSMLDKYTLVSNSDSHSPWPWRIGRECNVFDIDPSYNELIKAIRTRRNFLMTVEFPAEMGKYHFDGHRKCDFSCSPKESKKINNICPVCRRPLTIGVEHRVEELADRPAGFKHEGAVPFKNLIPFAEIISKFTGRGLATKSVWSSYLSWIKHFGTEFNIILEVPEDELIAFEEEIGKAIIKVRNQEVRIKPGYDGVYGIPVFDGKSIKQEKNVVSQKDLKSFF